MKLYYLQNLCVIETKDKSLIPRIYIDTEVTFNYIQSRDRIKGVMFHKHDLNIKYLFSSDGMKRLLAVPRISRIMS